MFFASLVELFHRGRIIPSGEDYSIGGGFIPSGGGFIPSGEEKFIPSGKNLFHRGKIYSIGEKFIPSGKNLFHRGKIYSIGEKFIPSGKNLFHRGKIYSIWGKVIPLVWCLFYFGEGEIYSIGGGGYSIEGGGGVVRRGKFSSLSQTWLDLTWLLHYKPGHHVKVVHKNEVILPYHTMSAIIEEKVFYSTSITHKLLNNWSEKHSSVVDEV